MYSENHDCPRKLIIFISHRRGIHPILERARRSYIMVAASWITLQNTIINKSRSLDEISASLSSTKSIIREHSAYFKSND